MGKRGPKPGTLGERPRVGGRFVPVVRTTPPPVSPPVVRPVFEDIKQIPLPPEAGKSFAIPDIVLAINESLGYLSLAALKIGCTRRTIEYYADQFPEVRAAISEQRELMKDKVELRLYNKISSDDLGAMCFYLKTQAKDRGYIERSEQDTRMLGDITIHVKYEGNPPANGPKSMSAVVLPARNGAHP